MGFEFDLSQLEDALVGLSKKASEPVMDKALDAGASLILKSMDKNVPFDTHELQNSLGEIKKEGNKVNRKVHLGSTSTKKDVVKRAFYQEYGNSYMNGKKWMKKSYEQSKDDAVNAIADSLAENLFK